MLLSNVFSSSEELSSIASGRCWNSLSVSTVPAPPNFFGNLEISSILFSFYFFRALNEIVRLGPDGRLCSRHESGCDWEI